MMQVVVIGEEEGQESREVNIRTSEHLNTMPLFYYFISVQPHNIPMGKEDIKSRKGNQGSQWLSDFLRATQQICLLHPFYAAAFMLTNQGSTSKLDFVNGVFLEEKMGRS